MFLRLSYHRFSEGDLRDGAVTLNNWTACKHSFICVHETTVRSLHKLWHHEKIEENWRSILVIMESTLYSWQNCAAERRSDEAQGELNDDWHNNTKMGFKSQLAFLRLQSLRLLSSECVSQEVSNVSAKPAASNFRAERWVNGNDNEKDCTVLWLVLRDLDNKILGLGSYLS
jgi:hypothetical protein